ncbi:MAG: hypothetical protein PHP85_05925 [Gallionella sp.]|nr:hypothetical protein [Gallionella sp.]
MFSCAFIGERFLQEGQIFRSGVITFDGNAEVFDAPIGRWDEHDYEQSWLDAISLVTAQQPKRAAIVTGFNGFDAAYLHWWPIYSTGDSVVIQEQLLILENIRDKINAENMFDFVRPRTQKSTGSVSEWAEPLEHFSLFGHCLQLIKHEEAKRQAESMRSTIDCR